ncbi:MAG: hypothetical protein HGB36_07415 [Chlorobiaceae bacterium]|nr:hypothetical protein [Chlorobiaceae bacterium]
MEKWLGSSLMGIRLPRLHYPLSLGRVAFTGSPAFRSCTPAVLASALLL